ncbi:hypothetical protein ACLBYG_22100 [Methylobacterium sp. D53M]
MSESTIAREPNASASPASSDQGALTQLWCMHISGPDDLHAAPDYWTALAWCAELNAVVAARALKENWAADDNYPLMQATVRPWMWSRQQHASLLSIELAERRAHAEKRAAALAAEARASGCAWDDETRIAINGDAEARIAALEASLPFAVSKHLSTICSHLLGLYDASSDPKVRELAVAIRACTAEAGEAFAIALAEGRSNG